ncbi:hypothetical protein DS901_06940 [Loktanella sp. D2R18]|jgi:hypothetical protein|uniref:hypothetical protein n=1 Tax=Rhodobacterales TaxID=204455 RepID=UPI000DE8B15B|nr:MULTISPECIES: hypothetical protein [Rhodobacterales]MDO6589504.1 hypothetical protein [Yoonia sp. 1_MG-2023]RBW44153.1 hypothetical protein DS901_06940 [Loktanella sp. D2R18]
MAIEIGNLTVRGTFGDSRTPEGGISEDKVRDITVGIRKEMRELIKKEIAASEQRIKEGLLS